jgi:hypothetical protein
MGQEESRDQVLFIEILCSMLHSQGCKVSKSQLECFLSHVQEVCPWFHYEGTINLKTWEKVGQRLKDHYTSERSTCVLVDVFSLWNLIRNCLDPHHEVTTLFSPKVELSKWEVDIQTSPFVCLSELSLPPLDEPPDLPHDDGTDTEALSPDEEEELEEQVAQCHHHFSQLIKLLQSLSISKSAVFSASSKLPQVFSVAIVAQTVVNPLYRSL